MRSLSVTFLSLLFCLVAHVAVSQTAMRTAKIYLNNGEYYEGQVVAISSDQILLKSGVNIISIDRDKVLYVFEDKRLAPVRTPSVQSTNENAKIPYKPLNKKYYAEIDAGITFGNPFAISFGFMEWRALNDNWQVGLGTSMKFFRYSMMTFDGGVRRYFPGKKRRKAFVDAVAGISYYEGMTQANGGWWWYPYDFSPVKQVEVGGGYQFDTGMGIAFISKLAFSGTWYSLTENYTPEYRVEGQYFISTATISGSIVF